ncbi:ATP-binding protein [Rhodovarius crocodyli]|uniref:ATP-binding protein n=2 Tax=Rhodovarius crocodyli TaxID=1979269 RepID=A0A437LZ09_9PROT|nr:ATP-binding protein [Rhodovarius crocodyli]
MIERCPKTMMIRELLKNAMEAAAAETGVAGRVEFSPLNLGEVTKLAIWNTGRGLTAAELDQMCDIASSIRKETGLDRNFGMGAKVAALPSNQLGMRYRSAHEGTVHEVVIGKYDGVYGRLLRADAEGAMAGVLPATEAAAAEGRDAAGEWTEVVLMGNDEQQNTVTDPYNGNPRSPAAWLYEAVRGRFFRFPANLDIVFCRGIAGLRDDRSLVSTADSLAALEQYEAVRTPEGIVIHYAFDPRLVDQTVRHPSMPWASNEGRLALVHRDECYGVLRGALWLKESPSFGIPFLARGISILIELPDDYPVLTDAYREFLRYRNDRQDQVKPNDFAALVVKHQPAWLIELLASAMPDADYLDDVLAEMSLLLEEMGVALRRPGQAPRFAPPRAPDPEREREREGEPEPPPFKAEKPPAILLLRNSADVSERGLTYRAAAYYPETHQLHVNLLYPAVTDVAQSLASWERPELDLEGVRLAAQLAAERSMVARVARSLAYGLAKRGRPREWADGHLRVVFSSEALTLAADDIRTGQAEIEAIFNEALKAVGPAAAPDEAA